MIDWAATGRVGRSLSEGERGHREALDEGKQIDMTAGDLLELDLRKLFALNVLLQLVDGLLTYRALEIGFPEGNPLPACGWSSSGRGRPCCFSRPMHAACCYWCAEACHRFSERACCASWRLA